MKNVKEYMLLFFLLFFGLTLALTPAHAIQNSFVDPDGMIKLVNMIIGVF